MFDIAIEAKSADQRGVDRDIDELQACDPLTAPRSYGLFIMILGVVLPQDIRMLPLKDFPPLTVGLFWMGKMAPIVAAFAEEMQGYVNGLFEAEQ